MFKLAFLSIAIWSLLVAGMIPAHADVEIDVGGFAISPIEEGGSILPGVFVANTVLPTEDVLTIPYLFTGDPENVEVTVKFDDEELQILNAVGLTEGSVDYLFVDITDFVAQSGVLEIIFAPGEESDAELLLVDKMELSDSQDQGSGEGEDQDAGGQSGGGGSGSGGSIGVERLNLTLLMILLLGYRASRRKPGSI